MAQVANYVLHVTTFSSTWGSIRLSRAFTAMSESHKHLVGGNLYHMGTAEG